jgi:hypothetical protein
MLVERVARGGASGSALVLPLVLIGVGTAFLLRDLGVVDEDRTLAPLVVIAVGAGLVLGALPSRSPAAAVRRDVPLGDAARAGVRIVHGAGRLAIGPLAGGPNLLEAHVRGGEVRSSLIGDRAEVEVETAGWRFGLPWERGGTLDWSISLARTLPIDLTLRTGAGRTDADLSDLRVETLDVQTGASAVAVTIPSSGRPTIRIRGGAAEIRVVVPSRMAARIRIRGVMAEVAIDPHRFPMQFGEHRSPSFEDADDRAEILIEAGAASVRVE